MTGLVRIFHQTVFFTVVAASVSSLASAQQSDSPSDASPAQADLDAARRHSFLARLHYNLGNFRRALDEYSMAYELEQKPALLFNVGQCYRLLGDYGRAAFVLQAYLREAGDVPNRALAEELIAESRIRQKQIDARAREEDRLWHEYAQRSSPSADAPPRLYEKWWFWTAIGATVVVVIAAGATVYALGNGRPSHEASASLGTIQLK